MLEKASFDVYLGISWLRLAWPVIDWAANSALWRDSKGISRALATWTTPSPRAALTLPSAREENVLSVISTEEIELMTANGEELYCMVITENDLKHLHAVSKSAEAPPTAARAAPPNAAGTEYDPLSAASLNRACIAERIRVDMPTGAT